MCKAILLCDSTIIEAVTTKVSIIGIFDTFTVPELPGHTRPFTVFVQLLHGVGRYEVVVEMQDLADDTVLVRSPTLVVEFPERLIKMNFMLPVPPIPVNHSGQYELVVFANGQEIDRQRFIVQSAQEMQDGNQIE